jgi:hypothetical protein
MKNIFTPVRPWTAKQLFFYKWAKLSYKTSMPNFILVPVIIIKLFMDNNMPLIN